MARTGAEQRNIAAWAVGLLASAATIFGVGYWITRDRKKKDEAEEAELEGFFPADETIGSNISHREALRRANILFTAMDGAGTDEDAIFRAQNAVNGSGLKLIYNKFGIREGESLGQWYLGDLSGWPLRVVRAQWRNAKVTPPF